MSGGILAAHAEALAEQSDELVPLVLRSFPVLRKPLRASIRKHRAFLAENIRSTPAEAVVLYGATGCDGTNLAPLADECRDRWMAELDDLDAALTAGDRGALAELLSSLVEALDRAVALGAAILEDRHGAITDHDLLTMIDGDTAFRFNRYLLEMLSRALDAAQPKSLLGIRST